MSSPDPKLERQEQTLRTIIQFLKSRGISIARGFGYGVKELSGGVTRYDFPLNLFDANEVFGTVQEKTEAGIANLRAFLAQSENYDFITYLIQRRFTATMALYEYFTLVNNTAGDPISLQAYLLERNIIEDNGAINFNALASDIYNQGIYRTSGEDLIEILKISNKLPEFITKCIAGRTVPFNLSIDIQEISGSQEGEKRFSDAGVVTSEPLKVSGSTALYAPELWETGFFAVFNIAPRYDFQISKAAFRQDVPSTMEFPELEDPIIDTPFTRMMARVMQLHCGAVPLAGVISLGASIVDISGANAEDLLVQIHENDVTAFDPITGALARLPANQEQNVQNAENFANALIVDLDRIYNIISTMVTTNPLIRIHRDDLNQMAKAYNTALIQLVARLNIQDDNLRNRLLGRIQKIAVIFVS